MYSFFATCFQTDVLDYLVSNIYLGEGYFIYKNDNGYLAYRNIIVFIFSFNRLSLQNKILSFRIFKGFVILWNYFQV